MVIDRSAGELPSGNTPFPLVAREKELESLLFTRNALKGADSRSAVPTPRTPAFGHIGYNDAQYTRKANNASCAQTQVALGRECSKLISAPCVT
ncbi:MAG: hypothetical protein IPK97_16230 [Ahniella sp.]|nr:hypothetical protein [Ahniella sp.]